MNLSAVPHHDLDAEAAVLSAMMCKHETIADVSLVLRRADYYADANRWVHQAIIELDAGQQRPDPVTVLGWLRDHDRDQQVGGSGYLAQLVDATPAVANVLQHAERVAHLSRVREGLNLARLVVAEGEAKVPPREDWMLTVAERFGELSRAGVRKETMQSAREMAGDEAKRLSSEDATAQSGDAMPTGIRALDRLILGVRRRVSTIIAGRPGHGKTAIALQIALHRAACGDGSHIVSMEMPREQLTIRTISQLAKIDNARIASRNLTEPEWTKAYSAVEHFGKLPLTVDDMPRQSVQQIRNSVQRSALKLRREQNIELRLVVVDYIGLCKTRNGETRALDLSEVSKDLAAIAKEFDVAMVVLSQLNRGIENRPLKERIPRLSDLRESGAIEEDAYAVIFVHREDQYLTAESQKDGKALIVVAKHRQGGKTGFAECGYTEDCTRFYDLEQDSFYDGLYDNERSA